MIRFKKRLFSLYTFLFLAVSLSLTSQTPNSNLTPGGANGMVFRFTKQVWLNPTVILAKQKFEQATNVKLLILPRTNASDTSNNTKIEKAFDKLLAFLVFKENIQGSIKFYFNPKNPSKPFTFDWSEDLQCKFNKFHNLYKDTIEGILNNGLVNHPSLNNFAALPFDSIIGKASRYCRNILLLHPAPCGENQNSEFDLAQINSTPAKLEFAKVNTTSLTYNGGYDILTYNELEAYYNTVTDLADGSTYKVGWKAIKDNDVLKLKLTKKQPSFDVSKLVFKNAKGTVSYNVSVNPDSTLSLSMGGQSPGSMAEVVAYYTPTTTPVQTYPIGAFNVKFYEPKIYNLVLVSLDANPLPLEDQAKLKDSLNKIYGPVFIQWNLSHVRYNLPTTISKSIHDASSGLLSNYMPDMQPIVSSFKNSSSYNGDADNTFYIILGASIDNTEIKGYMPRARNTGFVFVQPEVSSFFIRTLAHEVGHGAFNLKHIFSSDELGEGNKTQTNNLMDYASGRQLYKHQWDLIHDPSFVGWFEGDDEEGALIFENAKVGDFVFDDNFQLSKYTQVNYAPVAVNNEFLEIVDGSGVLFHIFQDGGAKVFGIEDKVKAKTYFWDNTVRWYKDKNGIEYDNWWAYDILNAGSNVVRPIVMLAGGDPQSCAQLKTAYANYNGTGGMAGFIGNLAVDGVGQLFTDLKAGGHVRSQALLTLWYSPLGTPSTGLAASIVGGMSSKLAKVGIKLGGKTLQTWTFNTILNIEIFKFNLQALNFTFKNSLLNSGAIKRVLYTLENVSYNTDASQAFKTATIELVVDANGNVGWRVLNAAGNAFKSIDELLTQFSSIIGNKGLKHLFRGEINSSGVASGVHHISAIRAGTARIVPNSIEAMTDGFYKASIEVLDNSGNWIAKAEKSTFFPDAWDEVKVIQEIQSAANNRVGAFLENTSSYQKYFGTSSSGYRIYIVRTPPYNNNIFTSWFEPF